MGFFRRLKEQVLWQQQIELIMIEACESNRAIRHEYCKMLTRECISRARLFNVFEEDRIMSRQDYAFIFLMKFLLKKGITYGENNDPFGLFAIRQLYNTILKIADKPHLKISIGAIKVADEDANSFPIL